MIVMVVLLYAGVSCNAQKSGLAKKLKGFKIGFGYGESYYTSSQSGKTLSLDLTARVVGNWQISGFAERNTTFNRSIDKYRHCGVVIGQTFTMRNRLELFYGTGVSYIFRSRKAQSNVPIYESGLINDHRYFNDTPVEECKGLSIPLKLAIDFKLLKNISVGIYTRSTFYNRPVFGTANASLSMDF